MVRMVVQNPDGTITHGAWVSASERNELEQVAADWPAFTGNLAWVEAQ